MALVHRLMTAQSTLASVGQVNNQPSINRRLQREATAWQSESYCLGAVTAPAGVRPRGSSRSSMHFLRKTSRASPCSRCWSAPNWQVAIFCFASTAKHGSAGKSTIRTAARNAQRDMLDPPEPLKLQTHTKQRIGTKNWHRTPQNLPGRLGTTICALTLRLPQQLRHFASAPPDVRFGSKADIRRLIRSPHRQWRAMQAILRVQAFWQSSSLLPVRTLSEPALVDPPVSHL